MVQVFNLRFLTEVENFTDFGFQSQTETRDCKRHACASTRHRRHERDARARYLVSKITGRLCINHQLKLFQEGHFPNKLLLRKRLL